MEFIIYNYFFIESFIFAIFLALFVLLFKQVQTVKRWSKAKEKRVLEVFPELTEFDLQYRKAALLNYLRYYLFNSKQRAWYTFSILGAVVFLSGGIFSMYLSDKNYIAFFCFAIAYYFIIIFRAIQPSLEKQFKFWKLYLIENPENTLNVLITNETEARIIFKEQNKLYIYAFIMATLFLLQGLISYIRFHNLFF